MNNVDRTILIAVKAVMIVMIVFALLGFVLLSKMVVLELLK